ncbi:MAG TPA: hypothetical protein VM099_01580 [Gemmatimonadaceae bacterium]|nr:hypothetical protein [Gemmatimonadaceae bacterium]
MDKDGLHSSAHLHARNSAKLLSSTPPEPLSTTPPEERARVTPSSPRRALPARGLRSAAILTVISAIVLAVSSYELIRGDLSTTVAEISAGVALAAFGFLMYGLLKVILALIESAGERRRQAREATERRHTTRS